MWQLGTPALKAYLKDMIFYQYCRQLYTYIKNFNQKLQTPGMAICQYLLTCINAHIRNIRKYLQIFVIPAFFRIRMAIPIGHTYLTMMFKLGLIENL